MQHVEKQYCKDGLVLNHICTRTFALMIAQVRSDVRTPIYEVLHTIKSSENHNWILPKLHSHCLPSYAVTPSWDCHSCRCSTIYGSDHTLVAIHSLVILLWHWVGSTMLSWLSTRLCNDEWFDPLHKNIGLVEDCQLYRICSQL